MLSLGNLLDLYEAHRVRPKSHKNVVCAPKRVFHRGRTVTTILEIRPLYKSGYRSSTLALTKRPYGSRTCSKCSPRHTVTRR